MQEDGIQPPRPEPCVHDWRCVRCGRRLLLRIRTRRPGGCGHCGSVQLEPLPRRPH